MKLCDNCKHEKDRNVMPYEMNEEDDLTKILLKYINKKPVEYGGGYCEKSYPVSALVDIVDEYTEIKAKEAFEAGVELGRFGMHYVWQNYEQWKGIKNERHIS